MSLILVPIFLGIAVLIGAGLVMAAQRLFARLVSPRAGIRAAWTMAALLIAAELVPQLVARHIAREPITEGSVGRADSLMRVGNETATSAAASVVEYPTLRFAEGEIWPEMQFRLPPQWRALPTGIIRFEHPRRVSRDAVCGANEVHGSTSEFFGQHLDDWPRFCVRWQPRDRWEAAYTLNRGTRIEWRGPWRAHIQSEWLERRMDGARFNELRTVGVTGGLIFWAIYGVGLLTGLEEFAELPGGRAETVQFVMHLADRDQFLAAGRYLIEGAR